MDSKSPPPPDMKSKCPEIFDTRVGYRSLYMPAHGQVNNAWLFSWQKYGRLLMNFLDSMLYNQTGHKEFMLRQAVHISSTAEDIIS